MNKKIEKKKKELEAAQLEREKKKARYDCQIVILEGQRETVRHLETNSNICLNEYVESDNKVKKLIDELQQVTNEETKDSEQTDKND